jgi:hypothetical protein
LYLYCAFEFAPWTDGGATTGNVRGANVRARGVAESFFVRGIPESLFL